MGPSTPLRLVVHKLLKAATHLAFMSHAYYPWTHRKDSRFKAMNLTLIWVSAFISQIKLNLVNQFI